MSEKIELQQIWYNSNFSLIHTTTFCSRRETSMATTNEHSLYAFSIMGFSSSLISWQNADARFQLLCALMNLRIGMSGYAMLRCACSQQWPAAYVIFVVFAHTTIIYLQQLQMFDLWFFRLGHSSSPPKKSWSKPKWFAKRKRLLFVWFWNVVTKVFLYYSSSTMQLLLWDWP